MLTRGVISEVEIGGVEVTRSCDRTKPNAQYILFGMDSLLGRPRASTVKAISECELIRFPAVDLHLHEDGALKVRACMWPAGAGMDM